MCNLMQTRVVIRWSPVRLNDAIHRTCNVFKQMTCGVTGHCEELERGDGKLSLRCVRCGWTSPGWTFDDRRPPAAASGRVAQRI
jgi:hypothetical protein